MKTTGFRSFVLYILLFAFLGGIGYFLFNLVMNGDRWVAQPYNGHIYASGTALPAGTITDRTGMILAESTDSARVYAENESVRRSLLHTVGDSSGYISTSVQAVHRSDLMGYNLFTGLNRTIFSGFGSNLQLSIDANANAAAYRALEGRRGAVFLFNYKTGETLVKVSAPSYDPMHVPGDLLDNTAYSGVFLDHTLSSTYTPGSIFKLVTAAAAMEVFPDWETRTYNCSQSWTVNDSAVTCLDWHGDLNMKQAMGHSCNIYFAKLALDIGAEQLQETAERMGFGDQFHFDSITTAASSLDLSTASDLELAWSGVGQADVMTNPYHMALLMGAVANGGTVTEPYLIGRSNGTRYDLLDRSTAEALHKLMRNNVDYYYDYSLFGGYTVCAKTGTAEVGGRNPNCWMVGFCEDTDAPYAFAVCVEDGSSGMYTAGRVVSAALNALY
ncbi:MAG: penicillin-binding protein [Clostridia bacterium]|nr:penicillin-binding protein [Clostridia bacterium]